MSQIIFGLILVLDIFMKNTEKNFLVTIIIKKLNGIKKSLYLIKIMENGMIYQLDQVF